MATKQFFTGMTGLFLAAAELSRRKLIVSPTSRGAFGADLLVTDANCGITFSVQVKTDAITRSFWLLNKKSKEMVSPSHIYILISLKKNREYNFYVVPSRVISKKMKYDDKGNWPYITYQDVEPFKEAWQLFEK